MFDFAFYAAHQRMLDLEAAGVPAFLRDKHGEIVLLCNDGNAYCNVTTYNWAQPRVRELWVETVINATARGTDGIFADHSSQEGVQIVPVRRRMGCKWTHLNAGWVQMVPI